jgi:hypothetical protein
MTDPTVNRHCFRCAIIALSHFVMGCAATAQAPPATRPDAATIYAAVTAAGHTAGWDEYADFDGCPEDDQTGRDLLSLVSSSGANETITSSLVGVWIDEFVDCGHAPLEAWLLAALSELVALDGHGLSLAIHSFPPSLNGVLSDHLRQLASDGANSPRARAEVADGLLTRLSPSEATEIFLELLSSPDLPAEWVSEWSGGLISTQGGAYVSMLADAMDAIGDDDTARAALGTVMTSIALGGISLDHASSVELLEAIEGRPGLQGSQEQMVSLIVSEGLDELRSRVQALVSQGLLDAQHETGLLTALDQASIAFVNDRPSTPALIDAFASQVEDLVQAGELDGPHGAELTDLASVVMTALAAA